MKRVLVLLGCCFISSMLEAGAGAERLAQSVRFATVSQQDRENIDYQQFRQHQDFLRKSYPRVFATLDVEVIAEHSLLMTWAGADQSLSPVLFTAHIDVVPIEPGTEQDWDYPPFAGVIADGMIYGRGTLDDKVGVISLLEAINNLLQQGYQPRRTLVFGFGHDEEISGLHGAANIARRLREQKQHFDWMIDEGGFILTDSPMIPGRNIAMINVAEKSYITLTLTASGEGGHSSMPPFTSSIGKLAAALVRIETQPMPAMLVSPVSDMLEAMAPHLEFPKGFMMGNLWLTEPLIVYGMSQDRVTNAFVRNTTAVTMFNAGVKENVVPQQAEAKVNFRLLPGETPEKLLDYIRGVVDDDSIEISYQSWEHSPPVAAMSGSGFAIIEQAVKAVYSDAIVVPGLLFGATDTRHYADMVDNIYRFHALSMSTEQAGSVHGTNERVGVESFEKTIEVAEQMMRLGGE